MENDYVVDGADEFHDSTANGDAERGHDFEEEDDDVGDDTSMVERPEEEQSGQAEKIKRLLQEIDRFRTNQCEMEEKLEKMKNETDQSKEDKRTLESVAARAAELEIQVERLRHDLLSSMSECEDARAEVEELKITAEAMKQNNREKDCRIEDLEKSNAAMNAHICDLELKLSIGASELKKTEEESKIKILEKDNENFQFASKVHEISSALKLSQKEKGDIEVEKRVLEEAVRSAQEGWHQAGEKVDQLQRQLMECTARNLENANGASEVKKKILKFQEEKDLANQKVLELEKQLQAERAQKGSYMKITWPTAAVASTGTLAAAAIIYLTCAGRK